MYLLHCGSLHFSSILLANFGLDIAGVNAQICLNINSVETDREPEHHLCRNVKGFVVYIHKSKHLNIKLC